MSGDYYLPEGTCNRLFWESRPRNDDCWNACHDYDSTESPGSLPRDLEHGKTIRFDASRYLEVLEIDEIW